MQSRTFCIHFSQRRSPGAPFTLSCIPLVYLRLLPGACVAYTLLDWLHACLCFMALPLWAQVCPPCTCKSLQPLCLILIVLQPSIHQYTPVTSMPLASKRSRAAKHTRKNAHSTFAIPAPCTTSPDGSEYVVLYNGLDSLSINVKSGNESDTQGGNRLKAPVEALQHLYSMVLPPHLCLKEEENRKPWKMDKRRLYTLENHRQWLGKGDMT